VVGATDSTPLSLLMTLLETRTTRCAACARSLFLPESAAWGSSRLKSRSSGGSFL